ncbi:MAG: hypothetical protein PVF74_11630 [Anaerolineales bacterium]
MANDETATDNPELNILQVSRQVDEQLDTVIRGQEDISERFNAVDGRVKSLENAICEHNGNPGLVAQVCLVQDAVQRIVLSKSLYAVGNFQIHVPGPIDADRWILE